jgi:4-amino-4-deoxy-L-arabinose transferase-like glycosyltransferase
MHQATKNYPRKIPFWLIFVLAILPLSTWSLTGLFDLDEGFYGAVVSEMNRRHEWITPYYNGQPWFEKPILLYWLAKPMVLIFGDQIGPRLPSVLSTIGLYALLAWFANRTMGLKAKSAVVIFAGSSLLILALGRLMMTDAPLNLALTGAFVTFWLSLTETPKWKLVTAFALGVGVLAKGPVALLLFAPIAVITYAQNRHLRPNFRGHWLLGFGVLFATVSTWYLPAYLVNGQTFVQKFLIEQNLNRFTGGDAAHSLGLKGLPFYIPILLIAVFPWGWVELKAFRANNPLNRFLLTWFGVIFVFFTISSAKLPHYILPVIAPLALLAASQVEEQKKNRWEYFAIPLSVGLTVLLTFAQSLWYRQSGQEQAHRLVRAHPEINVLYQLSRLESGLSTGTTNIQETSLPSVIMVLNHPVLDTGDVSKLKDGDIVFTRRGRILPGFETKVLGSDSNYLVLEITKYP